MVVTFCGHGDIFYNEKTKWLLTTCIEQLIHIGAKEFFLGGYGNFDILAAKTVCELKQKYPNISSVLIIPYIDREYNLDLYDSTIYPPLEKVPPRYAISRRNEWMVENSDIVVAFTKYSFGGAATTLNYAKKKKKRIIQLYNAFPADLT